jgi:hypothetical protein
MADLVPAALVTLSTTTGIYKLQEIYVVAAILQLQASGILAPEPYGHLVMFLAEPALLLITLMASITQA